MDKPKIGIRQADGSFYEILADEQAGHKRLVLSAARTDQRGVKIELFRTAEGVLGPEESLGLLALEDAEGLGYQDISFDLAIDHDGQLSAEASLPGQPPQSLHVDLTQFQSSRSDSEILADPSWDNADLDPLDTNFAEADGEPTKLDLPDLDLPDMELPDLDDIPPRSDKEILEADTTADFDLDVLEDFSFDEPTSEGSPEPPQADLLEDDEFSLPEDPLPDTFDMGEFDAGFESPSEPQAAAAAQEGSEESWEKISLDDMDAMEFLDTGDELSAPMAEPQADSNKDEFSLDEPLELGDYESSFDELPDREAASSGNGAPSDFDEDFLPPSQLTEEPSWDEDPAEPILSKRATKKAEKKSPRTSTRRSDSSGPGTAPIDKLALFLSLASLSLLLLLIIVLLFLNMVKSPQAPVIQPEVMSTMSSPLALKERGMDVQSINLAVLPAPRFRAARLTEVPRALAASKVSLTLAPGQSVQDAQALFGPARERQGDQLFW